MTTIQVAYADGDTVSFDITGDETVLDAAEKAGAPIAYNCKGGVCRACQAIDQATGEPALLCQTKHLEANAAYTVSYTRAAAKVKASKRKAKLVEWSHVGGTVYRLKYRLQFPIKFLPGQYARVLVPAVDGGEKAQRYFSMANPPSEEKTAIFYIKDIPDGRMSSYLQGTAEPGDLTTIDAPYGTFYLHETAAPKLFIAGGTGLAPMLSMLSALRERDPNAHAGLVFGVTRTEDLFGQDEISELRFRMPNIQVEIMMMETPISDGIGHGSVIDGLNALRTSGDSPNFKEAYLCGPPPMIDAVSKYLNEEQPEIESVYTEVFSPVEG